MLIAWMKKPSLDGTDEKIPIGAESTVDSLGEKFASFCISYSPAMTLSREERPRNDPCSGENGR